MLVTGETGARAAHNGYLPAIFGRLNGRGAAAWGLLIVASAMSVIAFITLSPQVSEQFGTIINIVVNLVVLACGRRPEPGDRYPQAPAIDVGPAAGHRRTGGLHPAIHLVDGADDAGLGRGHAAGLDPVPDLRPPGFRHTASLTGSPLWERPWPRFPLAHRARASQPLPPPRGRSHQAMGRR